MTSSYFKPLKSIVTVAVVFMAAACASSTDRNASAGKDSVDTSRNAVLTEKMLDIPAVPDSITDSGETAAYVAMHFWDNMDFGDTAAVNDDRFMERNFANYLSAFPYVAPDDAVEAAGRLVGLAEASPQSLSRVMEVVRRFLTSPNSSMRDEELYYIFLEAALGSGRVDDALRLKLEDDVREVLKNRQGTPAADFAAVDSRGRQTSLYKEAVPGQWRLVIFYDPECAHCHEIIEELKGYEELNRAVDSGRIKVMAVYADGDSAIWQSARSTMPDSWLNCVSPGGDIVENDLYSLPAMPVIYVIAPDNTVLLKDPQLHLLADWIYDVMLSD